MHKPYMIIGAPRTGTNMIANALSALEPNIFCFNEIFNPIVSPISEGQIMWGHRQNIIINQYCPELAAYLADDVRINQRFRFASSLLSAILFSNHDPVVKSVGVKLLYEQLYEIQNFTTLLRMLLHHDNLVIIHTRLRNILAQYYSLKMAERTGIWIRSAGEPCEIPDAEREIQIWVPDLLLYFGALLEQEKLIKFLLSDFNVIGIWYEDLAVDDVGVMDSLGQILGCPEISIKTMTEKQNVSPLSRSIKNFSEIIAVLEHTTIVGCFPEYFNLEDMRPPGSEVAVEQHVVQWTSS